MKIQLNFSADLIDRIEGEGVDLPSAEVEEIATQLEALLLSARLDTSKGTLELANVEGTGRGVFEPKVTTITRVPRVGERVRCVKEDWGDARMRLPVGSIAILTKVENLEIDDEGNTDWTFYMDIEGGPTEDHEGVWGIDASYGKYDQDYFDGKDTLEAFWDIFESMG